MRLNVYTEELFNKEDVAPDKPLVCEIVTANYVSSRTGQPMTNYGLRIYLHSSPRLHFVPPRDDDRSAVTFWCGSKEKNVFEFIDMIHDCATQSTLKIWHDKTTAQVDAATKAEVKRAAVEELTEKLRPILTPGDDGQMAEVTKLIETLASS